MRIRLIESLLTISAICGTHLLAEAVFSLVGLRYVPLRLQGDLPEDVRLFAQSSKAGIVPQDPVILLGDSYAQGFGDWLLETDPNGNGPFHSAHIINELTKRDVVTLGVSGAGSAEGVAAFPTIAYGYTQDAWYLRLPPPHMAVIYFYEGNDLNDNLRFLARRVAAVDLADMAEQVDRAIATYPSTPTHTGWSLHLPLLRFVHRALRRRILELTSRQPGQATAPDDGAGAPEVRQPNAIAVADEVIELPAGLQSPAMELTHPELLRAALVFERSLASLHKLLPRTPVLVAYIPSPLSTYRLRSPVVSIQSYLTDRAVHYPKERVAEYSNVICRLIRAAALDQHAGFLDLRPAIRAAASRHLIHGPRDFKHFNRKGMEVLGQMVAQRVNQPLVQEPCGLSAN